MRCLIIGGTGRVGSQLAAACDRRRWPHLATCHRSADPTMDPLDARDADAVRELLADYEPDVVFFAAPANCGLDVVAEAVEATGGTLAMVSGDSLFGDCRLAMREEDPVAPAGSRAEAQASGEKLLQTLLADRHLILRTSHLYGDGTAADPAVKAAKALRAGRELDASQARHRMPTYAPDFADAALDIAERGQAGTFHVVGPDRHTDFTFARLVAHVHGHDADLIRPTDDRHATAANRVWLDRFKVRSLLGAQALRPVADGLRAQRAARTTHPVRVLQAA